MHAGSMSALENLRAAGRTRARWADIGEDDDDRLVPLVPVRIDYPSWADTHVFPGERKWAKIVRMACRGVGRQRMGKLAQGGGKSRRPEWLVEAGVTLSQSSPPWCDELPQPYDLLVEACVPLPCALEAAHGLPLPCGLEAAHGVPWPRRSKKAHASSMRLSGVPLWEHRKGEGGYVDAEVIMCAMCNSLLNVIWNSSSTACKLLRQIAYMLAASQIAANLAVRTTRDVTCMSYLQLTGWDPEWTGVFDKTNRMRRM